MGLADRLILRADAGSPPGPVDDYWYRPMQEPTAAGINVTPDSALALAAVHACVRLLANMIATPPLQMFQRNADGSRDAATAHPLYSLLHDQPNGWQTSDQWRAQMAASLLLRGNAYSQLIPGPRGPVDQIVPLHPDAVTPKRSPSSPRGVPGALVWEIRRPEGGTYTLQADEMFHVAGPISMDGVTGLSPIAMARETIGLGLATNRYGSGFFGAQATPRGILTIAGSISGKAKEDLREDWGKVYGGNSNPSRVAILAGDAKFQPIGITAEDSQFVDSRKLNATEICMIYGVPPHMVALVDGSTSWGTGIEQQSIGFVQYTVLPLCRAFESAISRDLIIAKQLYYAEFNLSGFLRGDAKSRAEALSIMRQAGVMSANEWRQLENLAAVDHGDDYWRPVNMAVVGAPEPMPATGAAPTANAASDRALAGMRALAEQAAGRNVRKELTRARALAARTASDPDGWRSAVSEFYDGFHADLARDLRIPEDRARAYAEYHRDRLCADGLRAAEAWETAAVAALVEMAMEEVTR